MIIVIDGPSGSGKSSTAKAVAENLGVQYLDSGAIYRAVTWVLKKNSVHQKMFSEFLLSKDIHFEYKDGKFYVFVDGEDLTRKIRSAEVSNNVSYYASNEAIRQFVNDLMRKAVKDRWYIADGRDLGTAVFPDAEIKFYMDAPLDIRAERRLKEQLEAGDEATLSDVKKNLADRDRMDSKRDADPLRQAPDAFVINTGSKTFEQQVQEICSLVKEHCPNLWPGFRWLHFKLQEVKTEPFAVLFLEQQIQLLTLILPFIHQVWKRDGIFNTI